jgi:hypothetical protein
MARPKSEKYRPDPPLCIEKRSPKEETHLRAVEHAVTSSAAFEGRRGTRDLSADEAAAPVVLGSGHELAGRGHFPQGRPDS